MKFEEKKFNIPKLVGISEKSVEEHLKLYSGYVKHANLILEKIPEYEGYVAEDAFAPYVVSELGRRFSFEFDGVRNHEYYFDHFCATGASASGGEGSFTHELLDDSELKKAIEDEWDSFDLWFNRFKTLAATRGVGWAMLYFDPKTERLLNAWIDEQHLGHLTGLSPVLALDMWEHSYVADYQPSGKKQYIDDFFKNLNWQTCEENFTSENVQSPTLHKL